MVDDIESDLSVFHRVDDLDQISARRFFRLVTRLSAYGGVMTARVAPQARTSTPTAEPALALPAPALNITAQNADGLLANEMFGALPGMSPVFSHSTAPLEEG